MTRWQDKNVKKWSQKHAQHTKRLIDLLRLIFTAKKECQTDKATDRQLTWYLIYEDDLNMRQTDSQSESPDQRYENPLPDKDETETFSRLLHLYRELMMTQFFIIDYCLLITDYYYVSSLLLIDCFAWKLLLYIRKRQKSFISAIWRREREIQAINNKDKDREQMWLRFDE